jgi:hypothetical protein
MSRAAKLLWIAFVLLAAAVWLVDPLSWRAGGRGGEAAARREGLPLELEQSAHPAPRGEPQDTRDSESGAPERQLVDTAPAEVRAAFRLVSPAGEVERGARVLVARGDELLFDGTSDENGEVALDADGEEAQLVARSSGRPLETWTVRLDSGLHELELAEGAQVSGKLVCENDADVGGIRLQLECDRLLLPTDPIPDVVWDAMGLQPIHLGVLFSKTEQDGSFEFPGLPATWSGYLQLVDGWHVRSAGQGVVESLVGRVRLEAPVDDLLVVLAARATLRGRLLAASDRSPLAGASLCASLRAPEEEEPEMLFEKADGEGRFVLPSTHEAISVLELRLGGRFAESLPILELEGPAVPLDGELGDILVTGVRDLRFLLHESDGTPIRGGLARAAGIQSEPTGADGQSVLHWLPTSARLLWAEAPGFVPVEVELGLAPPDPMRIQLERAASLEVHLIPPGDARLDQFKVVVRREEGVAAGPIRDKLQQMAYVGLSSLPTGDLWNAPLSSYLVATAPEPDGVATFRALAIGVPLELEVRGLTGPEVYQRRTLEPFRVGETRRIRIALGEGLVVFRGRVVDEGGQPLARAGLQMDGAILGWTDERGAFLFYLVNAGPGTLILQHEACSTLFLHDYVVTDGQEVEFRLRPARNVTIEVVDGAGSPVPQAEVWILQEGFVTNTNRIGENRHVASSLTDNVFQIETRVGGRKYLQEHSSDRAEARVVVPVHGSVLARVSDATTSPRSGTMQLVLQPGDGQEGDALIASHASERGLALDIALVFPGRYEASLRYVPTDDERAAGRREEQSAPLPITVEAEQRTEIELGL